MESSEHGTTNAKDLDQRQERRKSLQKETADSLEKQASRNCKRSVRSIVQITLADCSPHSPMARTACTPHDSSDTRKANNDTERQPHHDRNSNRICSHHLRRSHDPIHQSRGCEELDPAGRVDRRPHSRNDQDDDQRLSQVPCALGRTRRVERSIPN